MSNWIEKLASYIRDSWDAWSADAYGQATIEQDIEAAEAYMQDRLVRAIDNAAGRVIADLEERLKRKEAYAQMLVETITWLTDYTAEIRCAWVAAHESVAGGVIGPEYPATFEVGRAEWLKLRSIVLRNLRQLPEQVPELPCADNCNCPRCYSTKELAVAIAAAERMRTEPK